MSTATTPDDAPPRRRRGRPRDEGADERILAAAAALMLDRGAVDVTVEEVAEQAGVGKATVYRRYPTKDAMASAALRTLFRAQVPVPDTGSFLGDLVEVYDATIRFAASRQGNAFLRLAAGAASRNRKAADLYRVAYEQRRDQFGVIVDRALERGELVHEVDRAAFLDALPALLMFRVVTNQPVPERSEAAGLARAAVRALDASGPALTAALAEPAG